MITALKNANASITQNSMMLVVGVAVCFVTTSSNRVINARGHERLPGFRFHTTRPIAHNRTLCAFDESKRNKPPTGTPSIQATARTVHYNNHQHPLYPTVHSRLCHFDILTVTTATHSVHCEPGGSPFSKQTLRPPGSVSENNSKVY